MQKGRRLFLTVVGIVASLVYLFPFYIMLTNSFKTKRELFLDTLGFPEKINLENYILAWERLDFPRAFMNSLIVTVGSIIIILDLFCHGRLETGKDKDQDKYLYIIFLYFCNAGSFSVSDAAPDPFDGEIEAVEYAWTYFHVSGLWNQYVYFPLSWFHEKCTQITG